MFLRGSRSQPSSTAVPGERLPCVPCSSQPGGLALSKLSPCPASFLVGVVKRHMHGPCAVAPAREGCHRGDTLRPDPTWVFSEQSEPTARGVLFCKELNCN